MVYDFGGGLFLCDLAFFGWGASQGPKAALRNDSSLYDQIWAAQ
jgi:hypothetical protein